MLFSMVSRARSAAGASSRPRRSIHIQASTLVSGVRSSCERVARNSSFRRLVSWASR